ncbi:hypothetical protein CPB85DRAFT_836645 [Mucidula mucida]|nr:hypothetical protein CPB85DRAFT_836645 [Mucidula mucida]
MQLFDLMTKCVVDQSVVSNRHLNLLGLDVCHRMSLHPGMAEVANALDSPSNAVWKTEARRHLPRHFNISTESGCRCLVDEYILTAVVYAQKIIEQDTVLTSTLRQTYHIMHPHIAVFSEQSIPQTVIACEDTSYTFYGTWDYALGYISVDDITSLSRGSLSLDAHDVLCGVLEIKSLSEIHNAVPRITAQVFSGLVLT